MHFFEGTIHVACQFWPLDQIQFVNKLILNEKQINQLINKSMHNLIKCTFIITTINHLDLAVAHFTRRFLTHCFQIKIIGIWNVSFGGVRKTSRENLEKKLEYKVHVY